MRQRLRSLSKIQERNASMSTQAVAWQGLLPANSTGAGGWLRTGKSPPGNFLPARNGAKRGDAALEGCCPSLYRYIGPPLLIKRIINASLGSGNSTYNTFCALRLLFNHTRSTGGNPPGRPFMPACRRVYRKSYRFSYSK